MKPLQKSDIQLLLIEDEEQYLDKATAWFDSVGYQNIHVARNAAEAKAKLDTQLFDVIVAEMRLQGDATGFAVLDEVSKRNITSVVIILTANETVADSRRAFKEGAWDYISKSMTGNVFEELDQSIEEAMAYFSRWGGKREDEAWIQQNMAQLVKRYDSQYIAVMNLNVIEAAKTEMSLKERLRERKLPAFLPTIKKIEASAMPKPSLAELIEQGESLTLAFKSSLQWDVKQQKVNPKLAFAALKTIAAFLNSEAGGTLLIGVADDGTILGLEGDLSLEQGGTLEEFEQTLRNLINDRISAAFSKLIQVRFLDHSGKKVCVVEVNRAAGPVFMKDQRRVEFYIREGGATRALESQEMSDYIWKHWAS